MQRLPVGGGLRRLDVHVSVSPGGIFTEELFTHSSSLKRLSCLRGDSEQLCCCCCCFNISSLQPLLASVEIELTRWSSEIDAEQDDISAGSLVTTPAARHIDLLIGLLIPLCFHPIAERNALSSSTSMLS